METTDTPTLTPTEPTQAEPAPEVEDRPAIATTEETEQPETPVEGEVTEETEQREPLPEGWQDHADYTEAAEVTRKEAHAEGYQEAQSNLDSAHSTELQKLRITHAEEKQSAATAAESSVVVIKVADSLDAYVTNLKTGGMTSVEAQSELETLMSTNKPFAEAFNSEAKKAYRAEGVNEGKTHVSRLLQGGLNKELSTELGKAVEQASLDVRDPANSLTFDGAVERILKERDKLVRTEAAAEAEKITKENVAKRGKAEARAGDKSAANVAGRAASPGGRPTPGQYADATREQRAEWKEKGVEPLIT